MSLAKRQKPPGTLKSYNYICWVVYIIVICYIYINDDDSGDIDDNDSVVNNAGIINQSMIEKYKLTFLISREISLYRLVEKIT